MRTLAAACRPELVALGLVVIVGLGLRVYFVGWRDQLAKTLASSTVNHHLASASGFLAWVAAQAPDALPAGNPGTARKSTGKPADP